MYSPRVLLLTTVPYHTSYTLGVLSYSAPFQYLFLKNVSQSRGGGGGRLVVVEVVGRGGVGRGEGGRANLHVVIHSWIHYWVLYCAD